MKFHFLKVNRPGFCLNFSLFSEFLWRRRSSGNFKCKSIKFILFFCLLASLGSYSIKSLASVCDCEKIRKTGECSNPNCIQVCDFQLSLNEINQSLIKKCLGKKKWVFSFDKEYVEQVRQQGHTQVKTKVLTVKPLNYLHFMKDISAADIGSLTRLAEKEIEKIQKKGNQRVERNCSSCQLIPEISALFKVNPPEKSCPAEYLKTHNYESSKSFDLKNGLCDEDKIFKYFEEYVKNVVSGDSEISKKLWSDCPDPCSFQVGYSVKLDEEKCAGEIDLKVDCTHTARKSFWGVPKYDVQIKYTGDLKCEAK